MKVATKTEILLHFKVISYPPPISQPQVTFQNSSLPLKWKVKYKSQDAMSELSLTNLSNFFIEITTENFMLEDEGAYTTTVTNTCFSSSKTVVLTGKQG